MCKFSTKPEYDLDTRSKTYHSGETPLKGDMVELMHNLGGSGKYAHKPLGSLARVDNLYGDALMLIWLNADTLEETGETDVPYLPYRDRFRLVKRDV